MCAEIKEKIKKKILIKKDGKVVGEEDAPMEETPEQKLKREEEERLEMIKEIAEEIHPGCWHYGPLEPRLSYALGKSTYPEGQCDCDYCNHKGGTSCTKPGADRHNRLLIHFPKTLIRNKHDLEHEIHDFYIAIPFNADHSKALYAGLLSFRTTLTTKELACGFTHSHSGNISRNSTAQQSFRWRGCCLGGQTALTDLMYGLYDTGVRRNKLYELLVTLYIYASWESLDGGPHYCMENLSYPTEGRSSTPSFPSDYMYEMFNKHLLTNPEILPEITGDFDDLAITNVSDSIDPFVKTILLGRYREEGGNPDYFLGKYNERNDFIPLKQTGTYQLIKPRSWYEEQVENTKKLDNTVRQHINLGPDKEIKFVLNLDEDGLDAETATITEEMREHSEPHPNFSRVLVTKVLSQFKTFKLKHKIDQRYVER